MTTTPHLDQAREWAKDSSYQGDTPSVAAACVIRSLPDEWIDAAKLRDVIERWRSEPLTSETAPFMVEQLHTLLPALQPRPEDVPAGEPWVVECYEDRHVGTRDPDDAPHWALARMDGADTTFANDHEVTLVARLVPDEHHPTDTEDKPEPAQPHPKDVPAGELWLVEVDGQQGAAERELPGAENPWWLMRGWRVSDKDITLVSRLVPEKEQ